MTWRQVGDYKVSDTTAMCVHTSTVSNRFDWIDCVAVNRPYPFIYIRGTCLDQL
jgi:hypothetical protein